MTPHTVIVPHRVAASNRRCGGFLAATSLTFLKPRFKRFLMPFSAWLACAGMVANQVTIVSIVGSLIVGGMLTLFHSHSTIAPQRRLGQEVGDVPSRTFGRTWPCDLATTERASIGIDARDRRGIPLG
jgi:hypothetical protein